MCRALLDDNGLLVATKIQFKVHTNCKFLENSCLILSLTPNTNARWSYCAEICRKKWKLSHHLVALLCNDDDVRSCFAPFPYAPVYKWLCVCMRALHQRRYLKFLALCVEYLGHRTECAHTSFPFGFPAKSKEQTTQNANYAWDLKNSSQIKSGDVELIWIF